MENSEDYLLDNISSAVVAAAVVESSNKPEELQEMTLQKSID